MFNSRLDKALRVNTSVFLLLLYCESTIISSEIDNYHLAGVGNRVTASVASKRTHCCIHQIFCLSLSIYIV